MITTLRVKNYKALRDVTLDLEPVHVLIGPNDSGKTSILEALLAICRSTDHSLADAFIGRWSGRQLVWNHSVDAQIQLGIAIHDDSGTMHYDLAVSFGSQLKTPIVDHECIATNGDETRLEFRGPNKTAAFVIGANSRKEEPSVVDKVRRLKRTLRNAQAYRWVPSLLALPVAPDSNRRLAMDRTGFGLALLLDDILGADRERFDAMERRACQIFP